MINIQAGPFLYHIDNGVTKIWRNSRASPAAANITLAVDIIFTYIISAMHYNAALKGPVIQSLVHPLQFQGIAGAALIGLPCNIKTETALIRRLPVRK